MVIYNGDTLYQVNKLRVDVELVDINPDTTCGFVSIYINDNTVPELNGSLDKSKLTPSLALKSSKQNIETFKTVVDIELYKKRIVERIAELCYSGPMELNDLIMHCNQTLKKNMHHTLSFIEKKSGPINW